MKKRLLALVLMLCMVVCWLPATVLATETEVIKLNEEKTITLEYGEEKVYSFTPEEDGYYVFYTPSEYVQVPGEEKYTSREFFIYIQDEDTSNVFFDEYYGYICHMYAGKTYILEVHNWYLLEDALTSTVCIRRVEPPTAVTLAVEHLEMTQGDNGWVEPRYDTNARFVVGAEWTSSNTNVVDIAYADSYGSVQLRAIGMGTATVTVTLPNGASDSFQVTVKSLETIDLQEEKTITVNLYDSVSYVFTPEVSGEYVFVANRFSPFSMDIENVNGEYQDPVIVTNEHYGGCCHYMEAGQSYKLTVTNSDFGYPEGTGTVYVDYYQEPCDLFWKYSPTDVWVGETLALGLSCNVGFMRDDVKTTWTSSDPSIISLPENPDDYWWGTNNGWFVANKPGVATLTGTLQNGVSISQTITVHEAGVYTVIDGKDAVVPEGEGESLTVRADGHLGWFEGIKVDGKEVAEENYTATSGSTIIELHADYLATLAPGKHTLDICFKDGNATTSFTIQEAGPEVEFVGASLSLKGDIGLNFFAIIPEEVRLDPNAVMRFTVGSTVKNVPLSQGTLDPSDGSYRYSIPLNAKNMGDNVTAQVFVGDTPVGGTKTLSIKYYADYVINNSSKQNFVNLMKAMLNYGSAAQVNFGYDTAHLVNADMSAADRQLPATLDVSKYAHSQSGSEAGIEITNASLLLQSETKIRIYFKLKSGYKLSDFTFTVDGVAVTPVQSGDEYYIEKANVAAKDLDTMYTFRLGNRQLTYCGLSYVNQVLNYSRDEKLINLAKALYAYNQAANAYFGA